MESLPAERHEAAYREWRHWHRARRRRDRDAAIFALWSLCEPEIWHAAKELAGKLGEAAGRHITVREWLRLHGLDEDEIRYTAFPAVAKAAKGYDPAWGASFQTYAYRSIKGALRSSIVVGDPLNFSEELVEDAESEELVEEEPDMWFLLELSPHNGGPGKQSDRWARLDRLDADTLIQIRTWLEENKERAIATYGFGRWSDIRFNVNVAAWVARLPQNALHTDLFADKPKDGLTPLQGVAIRADGKTWDLDLPIRAEVLDLDKQGKRKRQTARQLGMKWSTYRDLRQRMEKQDFSLDRFTTEELDAIARGNQGRSSKI